MAEIAIRKDVLMLNRFIILCLLSIGLLLPSCDSPKTSPQKQQPPSLPKSENILDQLLEKNERAEIPDIAGHLEADPNRISVQAVDKNETKHIKIKVMFRGNGIIKLSDIHIAGGGQTFALIPSTDKYYCQRGTELSGEKNCFVTVSITLKEGVSSEAELIIESEGDTPNLFLPLTGHGLSQPARIDDMTSSPAWQAQTYIRQRQNGEFRIEGVALKPNDQRRLSDTDYREAGLPGIISTFPVDRSKVITSDRYIPAVLENSIDSQLPGRAIAVVERNVYGSDNRLVLIPAGSRIVGHYQAAGKAGESRLDINWSRIIRPDGGSINIDFSAADVMGRAGVPGNLDDRLFEKYGASLLTSVIGATGAWALGGNGTVVTNATGTTQHMSSQAMAANRLGNDFDQLAKRIVQDNIDIRPVLLVPQGSRLVIVVNEDIWLRDPDKLQAVTNVKNHQPTIKTDKITQLLPDVMDILLQQPRNNTDLLTRSLLQNPSRAILSNPMLANPMLGYPPASVVPLPNNRLTDSQP